MGQPGGGIRVCFRAPPCGPELGGDSGWPTWQSRAVGRVQGPGRPEPHGGRGEGPAHSTRAPWLCVEARGCWAQPLGCVGPFGSCGHADCEPPRTGRQVDVPQGVQDASHCSLPTLAGFVPRKSKPSPTVSCCCKVTNMGRSPTVEAGWLRRPHEAHALHPLKAKLTEHLAPLSDLWGWQQGPLHPVCSTAELQTLRQALRAGEHPGPRTPR